MKTLGIILALVLALCAPARGQIAVSSGGGGGAAAPSGPTFVNGWSGTTSINTSTGAQIQAGDFLVVASSNYSVPGVLPTGGSGGTWIATVPSFNCSGALYTTVYTRFAAAGDIGATFSMAGGFNGGGLSAFRGVNVSTPIDVAGAGDMDCTGSSLTPVASSITLASSGDTLLWILGAYSAGTEPTLTVPVGYSTGFNLLPVNATSMGSSLGYKAAVSSGATGAVSGSLSNAGIWNAVLIGLKR